MTGKRRGFGSIVTGTDTNGRAWIEARYTPPQRLRDQWPHLPRRFARRFPKGWDLQAEQWLNEEERLIRLDAWTPPSQRRARRQSDATTFRDYATRWTRERRLPNGKPISRTTKDKYQEILRNHLLPAFGDTPVVDITYQDVIRWHDSYPIGSHGEGASQRHHAYVILKAILHSAATDPIDDQGDTLIDRSPARLKASSPRRAHDPVIAEIDELWKVFGEMPERLALAVLLGGVMGLREGEVCGLQRRDINLDADPPMLHVRHAVKPVYDEDGHRSLVLGPPKSASSVRDLDIPRALVPHVRTQLDSYAGRGPTGMVFPAVKGGMLAPQTLRNVWERCRSVVPRLRGMRFNDLRDTALTRMAEMGATGGELMAQAGHTSLKIASVYQRASDSHRREVMQRLDAAIADRPEEPAEPTSPVDLVGELERLCGLHARGLLSDEEFATAKARLLEAD